MIYLNQILGIGIKIYKLHQILMVYETNLLVPLLFSRITLIPPSIPAIYQIHIAFTLQNKIKFDLSFKFDP